MPHCRSRWTWLLALGALCLSALPAGGARAEDDAEQLGPVRGIKIGPRAVLVVDEVGNAMMYEEAPSDEPSAEEPACGDLVSCWGFSADAGAGIIIPEGGKAVQGVDLSSGSVFEEKPAAP